MKSVASRRAFDGFQPSFSQLQFVLIRLRPCLTLHLRESHLIAGHCEDAQHRAEIVWRQDG